ncbi:MAG: GTP-binding protein [Acidimicrobiia bacterium]|nr:GTP-binding protein [Acidimicrobiia bacterium]
MTAEPAGPSDATSDEPDLTWLFGPEDQDEARTTTPKAKAMPVTVLTGFLGAGKTTLLNRILAEEHGLRIAVLVNDFGEVDIDSELIIGVESGTVSLANGCVCCEVRDDLIGAIDSVLRSDEELDAIVLEASGVAEPMGIARTFTAPGYRGRIRLDGIVAVVDAEQLPAQAQDPSTRDLVFGQIGFSDLVVLNKIDLADRVRIDEVRDFVLARLPSVRIIESVRADIPFEILVGARPENADEDPLAKAVSDDDSHGEFDPEGERHDHQHRVGFTSWVYRRDGTFDSERMVTAIAEMPPSVYRIKGFLHDADDPDRRQLVQAVGMRSEVTPFDGWPDDDRPTTLVIIADEQHVDRATVERLLDACRA